MRNKRHVQQTLGQIEAINQSFIQFIRNTAMTEQERHFFDKQIIEAQKLFEQARTYVSQEPDDWRQQ